MNVWSCLVCDCDSDVCENPPDILHLSTVVETYRCSYILHAMIPSIADCNHLKDAGYPFESLSELEVFFDIA